MITMPQTYPASKNINTWLPYDLHVSMTFITALVLLGHFSNATGRSSQHHKTKNVFKKTICWNTIFVHSKIRWTDLNSYLQNKAKFILLSNFLATQLKHYYQDLAYFLYWCKKYTQSVHKNPWINFPSLSSCSMFLTFPTKFKPQDHNIPAHHMKMFDTVFQILVFRSSPKA